MWAWCWFWDSVVVSPSKEVSNVLLIQMDREDMPGHLCSWMAEPVNVLHAYTGVKELVHVWEVSELAFKAQPPLRVDAKSLQLVAEGP